MEGTGAEAALCLLIGGLRGVVSHLHTYCNNMPTIIVHIQADHPELDSQFSLIGIISLFGALCAQQYN